KNSFEDYDQQPLSALIGPFKSNLDICLYLSKTDKFDTLSER
ncbi:23525_t:CDS:2, partial [Racocetra persica]